MPNPKIEQFKKVLKIDPNDETLWFGLGKAYMEEENWPEGISALEKCIQVKPTYSAAFYALAQSLRNNNEVEKCREVCAKGIEIANTNGALMVIKNLEELKASL